MTRSRDVADTQDNLGGAVAPFVAGKNKVINGDFGVWQRGTTFNGLTTGTYTADRWTLGYYNAQPTTYSITQQSFAAGTAPVSGYEGTFFARSTITTVGSNTIFRPFDQKIEDVRTFAGQSVTFSLWAKADSARTFTMNFQQNFGTGGSGESGGSGQVQTLSTSWQRFTWTFTLPSISGKTIGTGSYLEVIIQQASASGSVLDVWGVQLEAGSVATPFTTASGSIGGELALCQRYYFRSSAAASNGIFGAGFASSTTNGSMLLNAPVTMRVVPTSVDFSTIRLTDQVSAFAVSAITIGGNSQPLTINIDCTTTGLTQFRPLVVTANSSTSAFLGFSAEL